MSKENDKEQPLESQAKGLSERDKAAYNVRAFYSELWKNAGVDQESTARNASRLEEGFKQRKTTKHILSTAAETAGVEPKALADRNKLVSEAHKIVPSKKVNGQKKQAPHIK